MKRDMVALRPFKYATRALTTNDRFTASRQDARVLEAIGKARRYVPPQEPEPTLDELREEAEGLGIDVDKRWKSKRLSEEIAKAKG